MNVVIDIWSSDNHITLVARTLTDFETAIKIAKQELEDGNLVNMRAEAAWGPGEAFDIRAIDNEKH